jgi:hypothetical protein
MSRIHLPSLADDASADVAARVTRFDVERLAVGELSGAAAQRVQAAIDSDASLKAFYDDVKAADAAFLIQAPPAAFLAQLEAKAPPWFFAKVMAALALPQLRMAVGACATAAVVLVAVNVSSVGGDDGTRTKGGEAPSVGFFVQDGSAARVGHGGEALRPGDRIQLAVKDVDKAALVVVGVDGSGAVSVYVSESVTTATKGAHKSRVLPASLVLDDTLGTERFFVVYGDDVDDVTAAATRAARALGDAVKAKEQDLAVVERLPLGDAYLQSSVHIEKVR